MSRGEIWEAKLAGMSTETIERKLKTRRIGDWKALLAREELERRAQEQQTQPPAPLEAAPAAPQAAPPEEPRSEPTPSAMFIARPRQPPPQRRVRLPVGPIIVVLATLAAAFAMAARWPG